MVSARIGLAVLTCAVLTCADSAPTLSGVVVITLDTTRADHLTPYGFAGVAMPALDRLAREGVVFDRALAPVPLTLPSHASLFTGLLPPRHGVRDNAGDPLATTRVTLAQVLHDHGFRTAAFVGSAVLDPTRGLARGFDNYVGPRQRELRRRGSAVIDDAIAWLDGGSPGRFFLWTHLYDAHQPYDPPEPWRSATPDSYVAELLYMDAQIGRLLSALDRRHLLDRTLVIVTADHGESRGEHGERDHGIYVYDATLRVPLIVRAPGVGPRRVAGAARLIDVMPTVLDFAGASTGPVDGMSLRAAMNGRAGVELEAYAESMYPQRFGWSSLRALEAGRYKFIEAPRPELYDLALDRAERRNIATEKAALVEAMARRVAEIDGRTVDSLVTDFAIERRQTLASLGYATGASLLAAQRPGRDPKDCPAWIAPPYAECR